MKKLFSPNIIKASFFITVISIVCLSIRSQQDDKLRSLFNYVQPLSDGDLKKLTELEKELAPYFKNISKLPLKDQALVYTIEGAIKVKTFKYREALSLLLTAVQACDKAFGELSPENLLAKTYLSWAYGYLGNAEMERKINYELLDIYSKDKEHYINQIADTYQTLAMNYGVRKDSSSADMITEQKLLLQGIELMENYHTAANSNADTQRVGNLINLYNSFSISSYNTHNYNNALYYARKCLSLRERYKPNLERVINLMYIGRSLYQTGSPVDSALLYADSALAMLEENGYKNTPPWFSYTAYRGEILTDAGRPSDAITATQKIVNYLASNSELILGNAKVLVANAIILSKAYIRKGDTKSAVAVCKSVKKMFAGQNFTGNISLYAQYAYALSCDDQWERAEKEFSEMIAKTGYSLDSLKNPAYDLRITIPYEYLQSYWQAGDLYVQKGLNAGRKELVESGIRILYKTATMLQRRKQWYFEAGIDEETGDMDVVLSDTLLNALYQAKGMINEQDRMNMSFTVIEASKAALLKNKLFEDNQLAFILSEPDNRKRLDLKFKIFEALKTARETPGWASESKMITAKNGYTVFIQDLRNRYKTGELKQASTITATDTTLLNFKGTIINYFLGNRYLYAYTHNNGKQEFIRKEKLPGLETDLSFIRDSCLTGEAMLNANNNNDKKIKQLQKAWYQWLLGDIAIGKNLIIIPHRQLSFISFEMLDKSKDAAPSAYVIDDHIVRYEIAASFMKAAPEKQSNDMRFFGGFAATNFNSAVLGNMRRSSHTIIGSERGSTETLESTGEEVTAIAELFNGTAYKNVSPEVFLANAARYRVLHIATHAFADQGVYHECNLLFESNGPGNGIVRDVEIMKMKLQAEMVVLSACNTGVGKLNSSEGVNSLGRSFFLAGCPAVVMSLWPVAGQSSPKIMTAFYKHIQEGQSKTEALRQAKLDYLRNEPDPSWRNPYYWAGFVVVGDDAPLLAAGAARSSGSGRQAVYFIAAVALLIGGFIAYLLRKRFNKS